MLAAVTAAPAHAATPFDIGSGNDPDVVVDGNGTGHFAWIDGQTVRYCRIPRGATACNAQSSLALPPHNSAANQGPVRVVRPASNRVFVITQISGGTNDGIWAYDSTTNGTSFAAPTKIGSLGLTPGQFGGRLTVGPGTLYVSDGALCCSNKPGYQRMSLTGPASAVTASFSQGFLPDIDVVTGLDGSTPTIAFSDGSTIFYRQYDNTPAPGGATPDTAENSTSNWTGFNLVAASGKYPRLAGAAGTPLVLGFVQNDHLFTTKWNGSGFPFAVEVSNPAKAKVLQPSVYVDPGSGRFSATWRDDAYGETELRFSSSTDGATWTPSVPIARGGSEFGFFDENKVATSSDGQGFAVWDRTGGAITVVPTEGIAEQGTGTNPTPGPTPTPTPEPTPTPTTPGPTGTGTAPSSMVAQTTVGNELIQLFGPTTCVIPGQKVKLRVTSKRKKKLAGNKGRSKILEATFYVDKVKKKDKKKAFQQSFPTDTFAAASKHKLGAKLKLKQLSGKKKKYGKTLKGSLTMCG